MTHFIKAFSKVLSLWPDTDYRSFIPTKSPSVEAWEAVGDRLTRRMVVEMLVLHLEEEEGQHLRSTIRGIEQYESYKYLDDHLYNDRTGCIAVSERERSSRPKAA